MYARIRQITCIFASRIYWHMCVLRYARPRTPEALPSSAARRPSRRDAAPSRRSATFAVRHPSAEACRPLARPRDTKAAFAAHEIAFAPRRLHEMLGGEQVQIRKFENGNWFVRVRAPRRRRLCPAGMSSPTGRDGCAATDETKSQVRARCIRRGSPQAIRHAGPDFVVARSAKYTNTDH